jgi:serine/threonine protein kinase
MALEVGSRLGHYDVTALIGEGGMGQVYQATDTKLNRQVALKILPKAFAGDPDRLARFQREAQVLASLNHPNIAQIHGIEESDDTRALVLELVEGPTLADRIAKGPVPVDEALPIAKQIAEALEAAHEAGVIHRDLKPANIKVRDDGTVKVLDFGLAKVLDPTSPEGDPSQSPTLTGGATQMGVIMGTAAYMAPEQVKGKVTDKRVDVWAFGVVVYEIMTGRRAFEGGDVSEVMAGVLKSEPEWELLPTELPPALLTYLRRCLQKDPRERIRDIGDVRLALEGVFEVAAPGTSELAMPKVFRTPSRTAMITMIVIAIGALVWLTTRSDDEESARLELTSTRRLTSEVGLEIHPAISPDGRFVVYAAGTAAQMRLFLRAVDGGRTIPLTENPSAVESQPRWSPDANRVLFLSEGDAMVVSALGGVATPVARGDGESAVVAAAWSPDGQDVAIVRDDSVFVVSVEARTARHIADLRELRSCMWSPTADSLACVRGNPRYNQPGPVFGNLAPSSIVSVNVTDGTSADLVGGGSMNQSPVWSADGRTLFFVSNRQGTPDVYTQRISEDIRPVGAPTRVTTGSNAHSLSLTSGGSRMVYSVYTAESNVWTVPVPQAGPVGIGGATQLTFGVQLVEGVRPSRDGAWLLYDSNVSGNPDIWRMPLEGGVAEQLTTEPRSEFAPDLSPDGTEVAYHAFVEGSRELFVRSLETGAVAQLTDSSPASESYPRWSPDGRRIVYWDQAGPGAGGGRYLLERNPRGEWSDPQILVGDDLDCTGGACWGPGGAAWSSDGRRIVYTRDDAIEILTVDSRERDVVYDPGSDVRVLEPHWSADEREVYFKRQDTSGMSAIWVASIEEGQAHALVQFDDPLRVSNRPELSGDGRAFYFTLENRQGDVWIADTNLQ